MTFKYFDMFADGWFRVMKLIKNKSNNYFSRFISDLFFKLNLPFEIFSLAYDAQLCKYCAACDNSGGVYRILISSSYLAILKNQWPF